MQLLDENNEENEKHECPTTLFTVHIVNTINMYTKNCALQLAVWLFVCLFVCLYGSVLTQNGNRKKKNQTEENTEREKTVLLTNWLKE